MKQKIFSKKANAAIGKAITVITAVVLGGAMMVGGAGVIKHTVMPTTTTKVNSMFGMSGDAAGGSGGTGGGTGGGSMGDDVAPVTELKRNGTIPEGGVYYSGGELCKFCGFVYGIKGMPHGPLAGNDSEFTKEPTATYSAGQSFPDEVKEGDIYIEGDFRYCYFSSDNGWRISAMEDKASYTGDIIAEISSKPVTSMNNAFCCCTSLVSAPRIPSSIKDMTFAFYGCRNLVSAPEIPNGVTDMTMTFAECNSLSDVSKIPDSVTSMSHTFQNCLSLTKAPELSNSVTDMWETFMGCQSIKTYAGSKDSEGDFSHYKIPDSVTNMTGTFDTCLLITKAPAIPAGVTNIDYIFNYCESLLTAPVIPSSVASMYQSFWSCKNLTGTVEVNTNPTNYKDCFNGTKITSITGSCSQATKDALMATK